MLGDFHIGLPVAPIQHAKLPAAKHWPRLGKLFTKREVVKKSYSVNSVPYENERKNLLKNISRKFNVLQLTFQVVIGRCKTLLGWFGLLIIYQ
jgi:hypothetical protein